MCFSPRTVADVDTRVSRKSGFARDCREFYAFWTRKSVFRLKLSPKNDPSGDRPRSGEGAPVRGLGFFLYITDMSPAGL